MHRFATGFLLASLSSACFADNGVKKHIQKLGRASTVIFGVLFLVAEVASFLGLGA